MATCGTDAFVWASRKIWICESWKWKIPPEKWLKDRAREEGTCELWADMEKCSRTGILGTTDFSDKWGYRLAIEKIGSKRE